MEQTQIVVGVVQHLLDALILEQLAKAFGAADGQRIDDRRRIASRQLHQVDAIDESVKAGALGIEGYLANVRYRCKEAIELLGGVDPEGVMGAGSLSLLGGRR
jgi:hypothetical protein